jgi:hypothetical protein
MFDIKKQSSEYKELLTKMLQIFELKKKYATKVLMNVDSKNAYITFDELKDGGQIEINLRGNNNFRFDSVCGVMEDEINEPLEHFETRLKEFKEEFLKKKKQEEEDITKKGFTELEYVKIGFKNYPRIRIIKSTGIIDFQQFKTIKCSWEKPIEKSTADKLMKLKKRDLVLTDGDVNFICHKISKIELQTNLTSSGTNICFGMVISFKNGEKIK